MWKVEVKIYHRYLHCSSTFREFFNSRNAAIDYCSQMQDLNADIILEDMTPIGDGEYTNGEIIFVKKLDPSLRDFNET